MGGQSPCDPPSPILNSTDFCKLGITTYNCKNIVTSEKAISEIAQSSKVIFLQEHWLFNYQLHRLDTISDGLQGCGKSVDDDEVPNSTDSEASWIWWCWHPVGG